MKPRFSFKYDEKEYLFGESRVELYARISEFMKKLENDDGDNVAVFTHSGWTRGMLTAVTGVQISDKNVRFDNCAIAIFEYENNHWRLHSWINKR
jgi:broad specificity phosphatase PhoE